jgi:hypothetical protein
VEGAGTYSRADPHDFLTIMTPPQQHAAKPLVEPLPTNKHLEQSKYQFVSLTPQFSTIATQFRRYLPGYRRLAYDDSLLHDVFYGAILVTAGTLLEGA